MQSAIVRCLQVLPRSVFFAGFKQTAMNKSQWKLLFAGCSRTFTTTNTYFIKEDSTEANKKSGSDIDISRENPYSELTFGEKVKEAGKTASYSMVIVAGLGVTGLIFYMIGREIFSSKSPMGVYSDALSLCKNCVELSDAVGEPMKGYGELTRRGRRRHVSHVIFMENGKQHMRMKFYVEGRHRKGTAHVEVQENESGKFVYRYLIVELDGYPPRTIVISDNR